jgi:acyl-CoA synthetase (NDP forming)
MVTFSAVAESKPSAPTSEDKVGLDALLRPRSVAIIGASDDAGRLSGLTLAYLKKAGFQGEIWPVNPNRDTVQGLPAFRSIQELPGVPDVAVVVVPRALVHKTVEDCAAAGVKVAMVFTTGFGESSPEGALAQEAILETARRAGMRLLGPNCLGCFNSELNFYGTFAIALASGFAVPGNVAVVSQSGAYGEQLCYLARKRGLGVRYFVSTGNEADIDVAEVISWLADQPEVDVILAYAEGAKNPARLKAAFQKAKDVDKQIIFMKVGRSSAGAKAAASHTASLAGDDRFWDAMFRRYGVYRAESTEEQVDLAYLATRRLFPDGRKVGILSISGGFGIQLCDAAVSYGLDVAPLPADLSEELARILPFGSIGNPLDASGQVVANLDSLKASLELLTLKAGYDSVLVFLGTAPIAPSMAPALFAAMESAAEGLQDRLVVLCMVTDDIEDAQAYEAAGYRVFADAYSAARALSGVVKMAEGRRHRESPVALPAPFDLGVGAVSEHAAKKLLAEFGVPVLPERLVSFADEAAAAGTEVGFPVVMKICSPAIPHKTEIGGVLLGVQNETEARQGYAILMSRAEAAGYDTSVIDGILVAPMASKGLELILGVQVDPDFGPAVVFGMGGIHVEVMDDVAIRLAPFDEEEAHAMIREIRGWPLLQGVRGSGPLDVDVLARTLSALSRFAAANAFQLTAIDINPFVVWENGKGGVALDALVTLNDAPERAARGV